MRRLDTSNGKEKNSGMDACFNLGKVGALGSYPQR